MNYSDLYTLFFYFSNIEKMDDYIDNLGFRSLDKVWRAVKERYPDVKKSDVKEYLESLGTQSTSEIKPKTMRAKMGKTYSAMLGAYQIDIFIFNRRYYLLAININTRYAYISSSIKNRSVHAVLPEIKTFVDKFKPTIISCDNEPAFVSKDTVDYLISKDIELRVITEQIHSALGIINRFCRTLRDMLFNSKKLRSSVLRSLIEARAIEAVDLTLQEAIKIYNNTYHRTIGMKPVTMQQDAELEEAYISQCIFVNKARLKKLHENIKPGTRVRFINDYENKLQKIRYRLSPFYYIVDSIDDFKAVIMAKDGSSKSVPLFRIVKLKASEVNVPYAETMDGVSKGVIEEIVDYNTKNGSAKVKFKLPDGTFQVQTIPVRYLREQIPTRVSDLEMEFLAKHPEYELEGRKVVKK